MDLINPQYIVNSLVFSLMGVIVFWVMFVIIDKLTPYDLWKEARFTELPRQHQS